MNQEVFAKLADACKAIINQESTALAKNAVEHYDTDTDKPFQIKLSIKMNEDGLFEIKLKSSVKKEVSGIYTSEDAITDAQPDLI